MSRSGFLGVLLLVGCASGDGFHTPMLEAGPGATISIDLPRIQAGRSAVGHDGMLQIGAEGELEITVEVFNNSDTDIIVDSVSVRKSGGTSAYSMNDLNWRGNEMIDAGQEHLFQLKGWGRQTRLLEHGESGRAVLRVVVRLTNGETYYLSYEVPILSGR